MSDELPEGFQSNLARSLFNAGRLNARRALKAHWDKTWTDVAIFSGLALECLMKSALASVVPALLADGGDAHSVLLLSGEAGFDDRTYLDCKTISADKAKGILCRLHPELNPISSDIDEVLKRRNTVAHLMMLKEEDAEISARSLVFTVDALLKVLRTSQDEFWGERLDTAQSLVEGALEEKRRHLERMKQVAALRLEQLRAKGDGFLEHWAGERSAPPDATEDDDEGYRESYQCPVCEWWGWLSGTIKRGDVSVLDHRYGPVFLVDRNWYANRFDCGVCGLRLGDSLLGVAGFELTHELDQTEANDDEVSEYNSHWNDYY